MIAAMNTIFAALADPTRLAVFERLSREGELPVHALTDQSGVLQPGVSKHLRILKSAGLVVGRRAGRETFYRVRKSGLLPLLDWMKIYGAFWEGKLDALEDVLERMDS